MKTKISMVDITLKQVVFREATVLGSIKLRPETVKLIKKGSIEKGDPLETAKVAGIMAAKNTSQILPLCHPLPITVVKIETKIVGNDRVEVRSTVKAKAKTGVEMEALTATSVSLLNIWDMVKKYEKDENGQYPHTQIIGISVVKKVKEPNE
ncbi:MAG: cyclic pyranopterin monophosphate synthase MoaC [Candidatus Bathyarchaeota archaeon]